MANGRSVLSPRSRAVCSLFRTNSPSVALAPRPTWFFPEHGRGRGDNPVPPRGGGRLFGGSLLSDTGQEAEGDRQKACGSWRELDGCLCGNVPPCGAVVVPLMGIRCGDTGCSPVSPGSIPPAGAVDGEDVGLWLGAWWVGLRRKGQRGGGVSDMMPGGRIC